ncbi:MAG: HD-GYP domain-containing protein [Firmicutes bacterium]|nr:HD-GYP domain-containing protein [Bacillota bacterium]
MVDFSGSIPPGDFQKILSQWASTVGSRITDGYDLPFRNQSEADKAKQSQQTAKNSSGENAGQADSQKAIRQRQQTDMLELSPNAKSEWTKARREAIQMRNYRDNLENKLMDFATIAPSQEQIKQAAKFAASSIWDMLKKAHTEDDDQEMATHLLAMLMKLHSSYTFEHSERVMDWTLALAQELGITDQDELDDIGKAAFFRDIGMVGQDIANSDYDLKKETGSFLSNSKEALRECGSLHDIGKMRIPQEIVNKAAPLTEAEYAIIKTHPLIGVEIVKPYPSLYRAIPGIKYHHEKWDGTGYPEGLEKEEIPLAARLIAVTDTFDAMTEDRPYRKGLTYDDALHELIKFSGKQFDPKLVRAFIKTLVKTGEIDPDDLELDENLKKLIFDIQND